MKYVFIIPEPHIWDKSFKSRINYPDEILDYFDELIHTMSTYDGEKIIIFPGDVFHRSFTSVDNMTKVLNLFCELNKLTDGNVYSVVGNHELSYPKCNPFWMLCEDSTNRFTEFKGLPAYNSFAQGIKVRDSLAIGNLLFVFGHYGLTDFKFELRDNQDCVLITHNTIIEDDIRAVITNKYNRELFLDFSAGASKLRSSKTIPLTPQLKYVFIGHMHTAYSDFLVEESIEEVPMKFYLRYLGSMGRTSITEVNDNDLIRTIPCFAVGDNSYTYIPFEINLKPYSSVVKQQIVEENRSRYASQKALKFLKSTEAFGITPVDAIRRGLSEYPKCMSLFEEFVGNCLDADIIKLIGEADHGYT